MDTVPNQRVFYCHLASTFVSVMVNHRIKRQKSPFDYKVFYRVEAFVEGPSELILCVGRGSIRYAY